MGHYAGQSLPFVIIFFAGFLLGPLWSDYWEMREQAPQVTAFGKGVPLGVGLMEHLMDPTCAAGDYHIWADLDKSALKTCNNGTVATLGPASGLFFDPEGNSIYMYAPDGTKMEYRMSPEWRGEKS